MCSLLAKFRGGEKGDGREGGGRIHSTKGDIPIACLAHGAEFNIGWLHFVLLHSSYGARTICLILVPSPPEQPYLFRGSDSQLSAAMDMCPCSCRPAVL